MKAIIVRHSLRAALDIQIEFFDSFSVHFATALEPQVCQNTFTSRARYANICSLVDTSQSEDSR